MGESESGSEESRELENLERADGRTACCDGALGQAHLLVRTFCALERKW